MYAFQNQAKKLAKELGAEVEILRAGHHYTINVDAPEGFKWKIGPYCFSVPTTIGFEGEAWKEVLYILKIGLELEDDYE